MFEPLDSAQCHLLLMLAPPVSRPNDASWHRPSFAFIASAAATTAAAVTATGAVSAAAVADYGERPSMFLVYDVSLFLLVSCFCFSYYCCFFDFYRNGSIQAHSLSNAYIGLIPFVVSLIVIAFIRTLFCTIVVVIIIKVLLKLLFF